MNSEPGGAGEYYLTDAFQYMVDHGARLMTAPVAGWYDCGKPETLLQTNEHLLSTSRGGIADDASVEGAEIVQPVRIESGAVVKGGTIGPNVTVEAGARIEGSTISHSIIGSGATLTDVVLKESLVGERARLTGVKGVISVAADSVVDP